MIDTRSPRASDLQTRVFVALKAMLSLKYLPVTASIVLFAFLSLNKIRLLENNHALNREHRVINGVIAETQSQYSLLQEYQERFRQLAIDDRSPALNRMYWADTINQLLVSTHFPNHGNYRFDRRRLLDQYELVDVFKHSNSTSVTVTSSSDMVHPFPESDFASPVTGTADYLAEDIIGDLSVSVTNSQFMVRDVTENSLLSRLYEMLWTKDLLANLTSCRLLAQLPDSRLEDPGLSEQLDGQAISENPAKDDEGIQLECEMEFYDVSTSGRAAV